MWKSKSLLRMWHSCIENCHESNQPETSSLKGLRCWNPHSKVLGCRSVMAKRMQSNGGIDGCLSIANAVLRSYILIPSTDSSTKKLQETREAYWNVCLQHFHRMVRYRYCRWNLACLQDVVQSTSTDSAQDVPSTRCNPMPCGSGWFGSVFLFLTLCPVDWKKHHSVPSHLPHNLNWRQSPWSWHGVGFREAVGHGESATFWTVGGVASKQCSNVGIAFEQGLKCSQIVFVLACIISKNLYRSTARKKQAPCAGAIVCRAVAWAAWCMSIPRFYSQNSKDHHHQQFGKFEETPYNSYLLLPKGLHHQHHSGTVRNMFDAICQQSQWFSSIMFYLYPFRIDRFW